VSEKLERSGNENREAEHEDPLGAQPVAQRAGGEDEGGEGDGVGVDDPLQVGDRSAEIGADGIDRHIDDGDVELHDHIAEAHGRECQRLGKAGRTFAGSGARMASRIDFAPPCGSWRERGYVHRGSLQFPV
jgi:hypothetical protein